MCALHSHVQAWRRVRKRGVVQSHREGKHGTAPVRLLLHYSDASVNAIYVYLNVNVLVFSLFFLYVFFVLFFRVPIKKLIQEICVK